MQCEDVDNARAPHIGQTMNSKHIADVVHAHDDNDRLLQIHETPIKLKKTEQSK